MSYYVYLSNGVYSVFNKYKDKIPVTKDNFPNCIDRLGERGTLLAVTYYISNKVFREEDNINEELKQEILRAIGE